MGTKLAEGVDLEEFDDDPPMRFVGKVDGMWFGLFWFRKDWVFAVAKHQDHLYVNRDFCLYREQSQLGGAQDRPSIQTPASYNELVRRVKEIVLGCVVNWRKSLEPKKT